jgi:hypothetical protein
MAFGLFPALSIISSWSFGHEVLMQNATHSWSHFTPNVCLTQRQNSYTWEKWALVILSAPVETLHLLFFYLRESGASYQLLYLYSRWCVDYVWKKAFDVHYVQWNSFVEYWRQLFLHPTVHGQVRRSYFRIFLLRPISMQSFKSKFELDCTRMSLLNMNNSGLTW